MRSLRVGPPDPGVVATYRAAGFTVEPAWPWMQMSIPPRQAWAFCRRGIDPEDAAAFILKGVTPSQVGRIRRAQPDSYGTRRQFFGHARIAWTPGELGALSVVELRQILSQDLGVAPRRDTTSELRDQVLAEQGTQARRGTVHWIPHRTDEVILYERSEAQRASRFVAALDAVGCWGDLGRLVDHGDPAGQAALDYLWDDWCGGRDADDLGVQDASDPRWSRMAGSRDLLDLVPPATSLLVSNRIGDGGFRFIDPYDPMQMGVPRLAVDRHGQWDVVASRQVILERHLAYVRSTLEALGWRLCRGTEQDLSPLK